MLLYLELFYVVILFCAAIVRNKLLITLHPAAVARHYAIQRSVCLSVCHSLGYRHAGCLQLAEPRADLGG